VRASGRSRRAVLWRHAVRDRRVARRRKAFARRLFRAGRSLQATRLAARDALPEGRRPRRGLMDFAITMSRACVFFGLDKARQIGRDKRS